MGIGAYAWGLRSSPKIALTFDDGPSEHTPRLLELLRRYGVKATFFVTGTQAEKHPELLEALRADGHQVESHGYWHRQAFLMWPWQEAEHIRRVEGKLYRPPFGAHSPFTRLLARLLGKKVALWDLESKDWTDRPAEELAEYLILWCKPGSILLLHDRYPVTANILELTLPRLLELGYQPVRMDEMELKPLGVRQGLQRAFQGYHERYFKKNQVERLGLEAFDLLSVGPTRFPGPPVPEAQPGVKAYEVHLDSVRSSALPSMTLLRQTRHGFQLLAQKLENEPDIRLIYGISYAAVALKVFGFKLYPVPLSQLLITGIANIWFMWIYRGELPRRGLPLVQLACITREELLQRYGKPSARPSSPSPGPAQPQSPPG
ncbi:polysaccharide deacetylase family protein [Meiothermus sp. PNK-Is4]|nr:polysaccharide deacetylase family protein [Meiothermus sp. Pnk-1]RYM37124.1 polysaccharide deacetylase family protein [Meiothermus sp. PNK-Is4]